MKFIMELRNLKSLTLGKSTHLNNVGLYGNSWKNTSTNFILFSSELVTESQLLSNKTTYNRCFQIYFDDNRAEGGHETVYVEYGKDYILPDDIFSRDKYRERIHLWRKNDVQKRVELQAHRHGMRLSRVCAWGTSKYDFDGSGIVDRHSVYHFEHGQKVYNYSLCTFQNGKIYNCDLSAAQNIGARFFLREYEKEGAEDLPSTPKRTLNTLRELVYNGLQLAA